MRPSPEVHDALACLLSYPEVEGTGMRYPAAIELISTACPETAEDLGRFSAVIRDIDGGELEELYTRTFDNVADRSLEIGWQLFGENYARGVLMVRLRGLMRKYDVPERTELPDHMTHVLALMARAPAGLASAFISQQIMLATDKILQALRTCDSHWVGVLQATRTVLAMHQVEASVAEEAAQ